MIIVTVCPARQFQSTPPVKAATEGKQKAHSPKPISIHAAREGGDSMVIYDLVERRISIHAAREGGDSGNE